MEFYSTTLVFEVTATFESCITPGNIRDVDSPLKIKPVCMYVLQNLSPGLVRTELAEEATSAVDFKPLEPKDVADAVLYVVSTPSNVNVSIIIFGAESILSRLRIKTFKPVFINVQSSTDISYIRATYKWLSRIYVVFLTIWQFDLVFDLHFI